MFARLFTTLTLVFALNILKAQVAQPTKRQLLKAFKLSIRQESKRKITTNSNPWSVCNDDSSYYKSDTIKLYPSSNRYPDCKGYCYIDWTFYKKDAFVLTRKYTDEPTRISVTKANDWYLIKLLQTSEGLFLYTYNQGNLIDRFKVIDIDENVILKRLK